MSASSLSFQHLSLPQACLENLTQLGYQQMTPIQAQALPLILQGKDVIGQAKTGSGKTVAFGLGCLAQFKPRQQSTQALILCPTRELADQVTKVLRQLARAWGNVKILTLCGGMPMRPQVASLAHGCDIAVGTPGRIRQHLDDGNLELSRLQTLIFDEADRMLDMGFEREIDAILTQLPSQRQTLLFSATYPQEIEALTARVQKQPMLVKVESVEEAPTIEQVIYEVTDQEAKRDALLSVLGQHQPESCVIFCNTKQMTQQVAERLEAQRISVIALHGDLEQFDRDRALVQFSNGSVPVLVATDVAARGLDIKSLAMVINYEVAFEPEVHVHRVGRTGRAGEQGIAISLVAPNEAHRVLAIEEQLHAELSKFSGDELPTPAPYRVQAQMQTLSIGAGRKSKMRPGDIVGALTADKTITGADIGNIQVGDRISYVAIKRSLSKQALMILQRDKIKGRKLIVKLHRS